MKKWIINIVKISFFFVSFYFILKFLYESFQGLSLKDIKINIYYLISSLILLVIYFFNVLLIWHYITKINNCNIELKKSLYLKAYSDFGKYVPGKIFGYGLIMLEYKKENKSLAKLSNSFYIYLIASIEASVLISIIAIFFSDNSLVYSYRYYSLTLALLCLILSHPKILFLVSKLVFKLFRKEMHPLEVSYFDILKVTTLFVCNWLFFGIAVMLFVNSFVSTSWNYYFYILGSFAISGLIGMFAFFTPSGFGVREGALIIALKIILSPFNAGLISILSRVWLIIGEILLFLIVSYLRIRTIKIKK